MEMAPAYRAADLIVCRAGATSIAEITAAGKASLLVPLPSAVGNHQTRNAEVLAAAGAAELLPESDLTGPGLADVIKRLYGDPAEIRKMETAAAALGNRGAAADIVDECLELVLKGRQPGKTFNSGADKR